MMCLDFKLAMLTQIEVVSMQLTHNNPPPRKSPPLEDTMNQLMKITQSYFKAVNSKIDESNKNIEASIKIYEASIKNIETQIG